MNPSGEVHRFQRPNYKEERFTMAKIYTFDGSKFVQITGQLVKILVNIKAS
jgi:hypothetical protein